VVVKAYKHELENKVACLEEELKILKEQKVLFFFPFGTTFIFNSFYILFISILSLEVLITSNFSFKTFLQDRTTSIFIIYKKKLGQVLPKTLEALSRKEKCKVFLYIFFFSCKIDRLHVSFFIYVFY
jgi:hypothetical protein